MPSRQILLTAAAVGLLSVSGCGSNTKPSETPLTQGQIHILHETNSGYKDLRSASETVFASYVIPANVVGGEFFEFRRMITEEFMAGVNFASDSAVLTLEQFWNGIKVQQCVVTPKLVGAPRFAAGQNRPLDIRTQMRREAGGLSDCTVRNHTYWQTDFEGTTSFGRGDEFSWGNTVIDASKEIKVEWKYRWSTENNHFYFDHLKVVF